MDRIEGRYMSHSQVKEVIYSELPQLIDHLDRNDIGWWGLVHYGFSSNRREWERATNDIDLAVITGEPLISLRGLPMGFRPCGNYESADTTGRLRIIGEEYGIELWPWTGKGLKETLEGKNTKIVETATKGWVTAGSLAREWIAKGTVICVGNEEVLETFVRRLQENRNGVEVGLGIDREMDRELKSRVARESSLRDGWGRV